ncbi:unnamed protein product [Pieris macdunnoughi]|uniref:trypsin n=2 Tax=Pieris macdunnoughi TaxID=345717 RepID=A0A821SWK6_9NEOP|nr:unnamed protein product [Pieris macdunnoughi]
MRVLVFLLMVAAAVAVSRSSNRIVGGNITTIESYPFMSNMQTLSWGGWWYQACGGSLITPKVVLSAAHCYYGALPSAWRVVLGSTLSSSGGYTFKVSELKLHENYIEALQLNDIAIVKLQVGAIMSSRVGRARIAGPSYNLPAGTTVNAVGWGTTSSGGRPSEQLRDVDLKVINQNICAERYAALKKQPGFEDWPDITGTMLCAGVLDEGGKDTCQGDSGGPLLHKKDILVGITSWGYTCAHPRFPGVNTRVSSYTNWIRANA